MRSRHLGLVMIAVSIGLVGPVGCGAESDEPIEEPAEDPVASVADTAELPVDASPDGAPFPGLVGEARQRTYELSLVNRTAADLIIHASAGAGRVVLDTVPGQDSTRVNVQIRARRVTLEAEDGAGRTVRSDVLDLVPAGPNRWEIRPASE